MYIVLTNNDKTLKHLVVDNVKSISDHIFAGSFDAESSAQ